MEVANGLSSVMWVSNSSNRSVESTPKVSPTRERVKLRLQDAQYTPASSPSAIESRIAQIPKGF